VTIASPPISGYAIDFVLIANLKRIKFTDMTLGIRICASRRVAPRCPVDQAKFEPNDVRRLVSLYIVTFSVTEVVAFALINGITLVCKA